MIKIRETTKEDISEIRKLYAQGVTDKELEWALLCPMGNRAKRSFVSISDDGSVTGHAGYIISEYLYNDKKVTGVHPIFWVVAPAFRGKGVGSELMRKALSYGDFSFIIGGAPDSHKLYPIFGLKFKFGIRTYDKIIRSADYLIKHKGAIIKKAHKTMLLACADIRRISSGPVSGGVSVESCSSISGNLSHHPRDVFYNIAGSEYVKWFLACPLVEAHALIIKQDGREAGFAICYVNNDSPAPTGRIIHISYLGKDQSLWRGAISAAERFLYSKGCVAISVLASHPDYVKALGGLGYASLARSGRPFFISDAKGVTATVPDSAWHWTFIEGDMGYRGV